MRFPKVTKLLSMSKLMGIVKVIAGIYAYNAIQSNLTVPWHRYIAYGVGALFGVYYPAAKAIIAWLTAGQETTEV